MGYITDDTTLWNSGGLPLSEDHEFYPPEAHHIFCSIWHTLC